MVRPVAQGLGFESDPPPRVADGTFGPILSPSRPVTMRLSDGIRASPQRLVVAKATVSVSEERPRGSLFSFHRLSAPTDHAPGSGSDCRDPPIGSGPVGAVALAHLGHWTLVRRDSEAQNSFRMILSEEVMQLVGRVCIKRLSGAGSSGDLGSPGRADPRK